MEVNYMKQKGDGKSAAITMGNSQRGESSKACPSGTIKCGSGNYSMCIDTSGNTKSQADCPINQVFLVSNSDASTKYSTFKKLPFGGNYSLVYNNKAV